MEFFQDWSRGELVSAGIFIVGLVGLVYRVYSERSRQSQVLAPSSTSDSTTAADLSMEVQGSDWQQFLVEESITVSGYGLVVAVTNNGPGVARNVRPFVNGNDMFDLGGELLDDEREDWNVVKPGHTVKARAFAWERIKRVTVRYEDDHGDGCISDQPPFKKATRF
jgi:hypothetical protein